MPNYALGQQVSRTDDRVNATYETVFSPQGNGIVKGYLVRPVSADTRNATPTKLPGILVIHENRGLKPHIEDIARRLALANFMAFAPDGLTTVGGFPGPSGSFSVRMSGIGSRAGQYSRLKSGYVRFSLAESSHLLVILSSVLTSPSTSSHQRSHRLLLPRCLLPFR